MEMDNEFWNIAGLTHPDEPWAVHQPTREGIQAYLAMTHAQDELARIGRETRQCIKWGLAIGAKLIELERVIEANGAYIFFI